MPYLSLVLDPVDAPDFIEAALTSAVLDGAVAVLTYDLSAYAFASVDAAGRALTKRTNKWRFGFKTTIPSGCPIEELNVVVTFNGPVAAFQSLNQEIADGTDTEFTYPWLYGQSQINPFPPLSAVVRLKLFDTGVRDDIMSGVIPSFFTVQSSNYELL